jgi:DTW domain-containing protein YfiP
MKKPSILLLTHEREISKPTNTASCAINVFPKRVHQFIWHRTEPDPGLLKLLELKRVGLVYPNANGDTELTTANECDHWLILDGTWQEARKIFNRSSYLHNLPRIQLTPAHPSQYQLRRNQKPNGLSTAECIALLLKENSETEECNQVLAEFTHFNTR